MSNRIGLSHVLGILVFTSGVFLTARVGAHNQCCQYTGHDCSAENQAVCTAKGGSFRKNERCAGPNFTRCVSDPCTAMACTTAADCNDNNPCTVDSCSGAFLCTFTPLDGTPCNDGDPCTINETCDNGSCQGTDSCHFTCYETDKQATTPIPGVTLVDQFGSSTVQVERPLDLCAPANKNGESPGAETANPHLVAYRTKGPRFSPRFNLQVTNQFGTVTVDAIRQHRLLVPSSKSLAGPPPPLSSAMGAFIDHFQCYKIRRSRGTPRFPQVPDATLVDQFGTTTVQVKTPRLLCAPVDKNGENLGAENHVTHLMCYKVKSPPVGLTGVPIFVNNQFGPQTLAIEHRRELCVPSTKSPSGAFLEEEDAPGLWD